MRTHLIQVCCSFCFCRVQLFKVANAVYSLQHIGNWEKAPHDLLLAGYARNSDGSPEQIVAYQIDRAFNILSYFGKFPIVADPERASCFHAVTVAQWYFITRLCSITNILILGNFLYC